MLSSVNSKPPLGTKMYFGGMEGGATHSKVVICDETGKVLGQCAGPGTNHWALGIEQCATRIVEMMQLAKAEARLPRDKPLDALGLTLSGCEQESSNKELADRVREMDATCAKVIHVASDTAGSLYTGAPKGGIVLIAGTGSNALLFDCGNTYKCGGWGFLLGDEGGAYWIAHRAVKTVFDHEDGLKRSPHLTYYVWETIKQYFGIQTREDLLPIVYKHFDKSRFAGLTLELAALWSRGDALARHLFAEAGGALAAHAAALARRSARRRLRVVCVGSVWNSWDALKPGMLKELDFRKVNTELELVRLRVTSALGAAWLAAKQLDFELPRDDAAFCEIFYTYTPRHVDNDMGKRNGKVDVIPQRCMCEE